MKRIFDFLASFVGLIIFSPLLLFVMFLVWINDFGNPFYTAMRVGKDEKTFKMFKLRSMIVNADKSGVDSTSNNDMRITRIGKFIRKFKMDELVTRQFNAENITPQTLDIDFERNPRIHNVWRITRRSTFG